jgi:hypothetical protein
VIQILLLLLYSLEYHHTSLGLHGKHPSAPILDFVSGLTQAVAIDKGAVSVMIKNEGK